MKKMQSTILILSTLAVALIAGLYYAYSCSVNIGLGLLSDKEYIAAMQAINKAIINPLFFLSFFGALVLLPLAAWLTRDQPAFAFMLWAAVIYVGGSFLVTVIGNVPLNETLAQIDLQNISPEQITQYRINFEAPWNKLHTIRTVSSVASLVLAIIGCLKSN